MAFFSSKSEDKLLLILDIQSSVVRGSLVRIKSENLEDIKIIFAHERAVSYRDNVTSKELIRSALQGVSESITSVLRYISVHRKIDDMPDKINSVHYVLSSPWIISQARMISTTFHKDTEISQDRVKDILNKQRSAFTMNMKDKIEVVEEKILDVRLNGYSVANWENRLARRVDVSFVISVAGAEMIDQFMESARRATSENRIFFHSSSLLHTIGMRIAMPSHGSYTLIHIHGEQTDVAVVDKSTCVFFGSYPIGVLTILRKIAKLTKVNLQTADSLLNLYLSGHLDGAKHKMLSPIMDSVAGEWNRKYDRISRSDETPASPSSRHVILFCRFHEGFFLKAFSSAYPNMLPEKLSPDDIASRVSYNPNVERLRTTGLFALAINNIDSN